MTPQERQLIDDLFDRLAKLENAPRDPEAMSAIMQGLRKAPNAVYALVQTALVQDEALKRANDRIQELEAAHTWPSKINPAASSIRCATRSSGRSQPRGSVPNVRAPDMGGRPVWNSGQVLQQSQSPGHMVRPTVSLWRPAVRRPALWRAAAAVRRRRWRLVPRNRGGGRRRRGRRIAAARQHPLDDGRRRPPGLRRFVRASATAAETRRRGAISPAAIWRATPGSTTSARPPASAPTTIPVRARACSTRPRTMTITTWITIPTASTTTADGDSDYA